MAAPGPQDASQTALGAPKTPPGRLQDACKSAQDVFKSAQEPPRRLEDASKSLQEGQRAPKTCPRGPQEPPMEGHRGPLQNKVHHTTWPQDCPVDKACLTLQPAPRRHCLTLHVISTATDSRSIE